MKCISMAGISLTTEDFHWVITVPAIWQAKGKQMMREAGYLVHIVYSDKLYIMYIYRQGCVDQVVFHTCHMHPKHKFSYLRVRLLHQSYH